MVRTSSFISLLLLVLPGCTEREYISINKIEHFYISSYHAQKIFNMLTRQFNLPIVWDYQDWGGFSSGGVTLGNVVFELIENETTEPQNHYGIALEPKQSLERASSFSDPVNISHGKISKASRWSTMSLINLLPDDINLFLCDYHEREFITLNRKNATEKLLENKGGTLGIQFLETIVIGTTDPLKYENEMAKLPGILKWENEFHFSAGPGLKLVKSDTPFFALLIKVKSIDKARLSLETPDLKTRITDQGIEINDELLSTKITLFE